MVVLEIGIYIMFDPTSQCSFPRALDMSSMYIAEMANSINAWYELHVDRRE